MTRARGAKVTDFWTWVLIMRPVKPYDVPVCAWLVHTVGLLLGPITQQKMSRPFSLSLGCDMRYLTALPSSQRQSVQLFGHFRVDPAPSMKRYRRLIWKRKPGIVDEVVLGVTQASWWLSLGKAHCPRKLSNLAWVQRMLTCHLPITIYLTLEVKISSNPLVRAKKRENDEKDRYTVQTSFAKTFSGNQMPVLAYDTGLRPDNLLHVTWDAHAVLLVNNTIVRQLTIKTWIFKWWPSAWRKILNSALVISVWLIWGRWYEVTRSVVIFK